MQRPLSRQEYGATMAYNKGYDLQEVGDIDGAILGYKAAADLGATDAMSRLGTIYDDIKLPSEPKPAIYWYKRGVKAGDSDCAWNLAMHYAGRGNKRWYLHWLRVADRMGNPNAKSELRESEWWTKRNPN